MYKIEIFQKNESFFEDLVEFIFEKSPNLKRDNFIDNILNTTHSIIENIDYFKKLRKIELHNVFGSTFQSYYRSNDNIYAISHIITHLEFDGDKVYGYVEPSKYGDIIDFDQGTLMPVYFKIKEDSNYKIATFDIDFNTNKIIA